MYKKNRILISFCCLVLVLSNCTSQVPNLSQAGIERLGPSGYGFQNPVWSPDGTLIAVTTKTVVQSWTSEIFILEVSTGKKKSIMSTDYGDVKARSWSPDGSNLLLISQKGGEWPEGIWTLDTEGKSPAKFLVEGYDAAWSPNGKSIAVFSLFQEEGYWIVELSLFSIETDAREILYQDKATDVTIGSIGWSPDGKSIIFSYGKKNYIEPPAFDNIDIYILDIVTKDLKKITEQGQNYSPSWDASGNLIAYTNRPGKGLNTNLFIADRRNTCKQKLIENDDLWGVSWAPNGKYIAFVSHGEVYLLVLKKFPPYESICP